MTIHEALTASSLLAGGAVGNRTLTISQSWGSSASLHLACEEDKLVLCLWLFWAVSGSLVLRCMGESDRLLQRASEPAGHGLPRGASSASLELTWSGVEAACGLPPGHGVLHLRLGLHCFVF